MYFTSVFSRFLAPRASLGRSVGALLASLGLLVGSLGLLLVPLWHQEGPKMPKKRQDEPGEAQEKPKRPYLRPKRSPGGHILAGGRIVGKPPPPRIEAGFLVGVIPFLGLPQRSYRTVKGELLYSSTPKRVGGFTAFSPS